MKIVRSKDNQGKRKDQREFSYKVSFFGIIGIALIIIIIISLFSCDNIRPVSVFEYEHVIYADSSQSMNRKWRLTGKIETKYAMTVPKKSGLKLVIYWK